MTQQNATAETFGEVFTTRDIKHCPMVEVVDLFNFCKAIIDIKARPVRTFHIESVEAQQGDVNLNKFVNRSHQDLNVIDGDEVNSIIITQTTKQGKPMLSWRLRPVMLSIKGVGLCQH